MHRVQDPPLHIESDTIQSAFLDREVKLDFFCPTAVTDPASMSLLLINDGQDMAAMHFRKILEKIMADGKTGPLLCVAIHCGPERKMEYGVAAVPDYLGRGAKAGAYTSFIFDELLPVIREKFNVPSFKEKVFAGFSLGGLSAMDIVWTHPSEFSKVGVFSGSFWWRSVDQSDPAYDDDQHRIMHQQVRNGTFHPWLRFFFQCGALDEKKDRNHNGIIDSIDDTLDLISELEQKGYSREKNITYLELPEGKHDVATWGEAMPVFLEWAFGSSQKS